MSNLLAAGNIYSCQMFIEFHGERAFASAQRSAFYWPTNPPAAADFSIDFGLKRKSESTDDTFEMFIQYSKWKY